MASHNQCEPTIRTLTAQWSESVEGSFMCVRVVYKRPQNTKSKYKGKNELFLLLIIYRSDYPSSKVLTTDKDIPKSVCKELADKTAGVRF